MKILVINAGSSSLKYQLIDMENESVLAKGNCDRIGIDGIFSYSSEIKGKFEKNIELPNHTIAAKLVIDTLTHGEYAVLNGVEEIGAVGHRIVQGGDYFKQAVLVDDDVIFRIEDYQTLAPLHAIPNAAGIRACREVMPDKKQVVVFDTAFHQTMPKHAYMYALPIEYYDKYKIRRYGFHGTSHKYVSQRAADFIGKPVEDLKMVTLHLGNGSSLCAIENGKCIDTSMGLTPLEGPMMGTRCGSIDPAAVAVILDKEKITGDELSNIMNKKSGMLAISGVSSDFRDVSAAADAGNKYAQLALDMFAYQCKKILAGYIAALGGVDMIVFTAGVGENVSRIREAICKNLDYMGIKIDLEKNGQRGRDADISAPDAKVKTLIIATNEELMIARETLNLI